MRYTVEIGDSAGQSFQIAISIPLFGEGGSWRSLDKGFIIHNSGGIKQVVQVMFGSRDLYLTVGGKWGIQLLEFIDEGLIGQFTTNDEGTGQVVQPWVLALQPGGIEWSIV